MLQNDLPEYMHISSSYMHILKKGLENCKVTFYFKTKIEIDFFSKELYSSAVDMIAFFLYYTVFT